MVFIDFFARDTWTCFFFKLIDTSCVERWKIKKWNQNYPIVWSKFEVVTKKCWHLKAKKMEFSADEKSNTIEKSSGLLEKWKPVARKLFMMQKWLLAMTQ